MKIERNGSKHDHGTQRTEASFNHYGWGFGNNTIGMSAYDVEDFYNKGTHHNWYVSVTLDELRRMIDVVGDRISDTPDVLPDVGATMAPSLPAILKIALAAAEHATRLDDQNPDQSLALSEA